MQPGPITVTIWTRAPTRTPEVTVTSIMSGNVTVDGLISNETGTVSFLWTGDVLRGNLLSNPALVGTLLLSPVWAHILIVSGAQDIGTDNARFEAYLAPYNGDDAVVDMDAAGNIYAELTLAEIQRVSTLPQNVSQTPITGTICIDNITAGGVNDILLPYAIRLPCLADMAAVSVVMPGLLEYTSSTVSVVSVTLSDLIRYTTGVSPADGSVSYTLPNGAQVYTDENGKVLRIVTSDGSDYDLTNYSYSLSGNELIMTFIDSGVTINLTTGILHVPEHKTVYDENGDPVDLGDGEGDEGYETVRRIRRQRHGKRMAGGFGQRRRDSAGNRIHLRQQQRRHL